MIDLHILEASGRLGDFRLAIERAYTEVLPKIQERLELPDVDIVVADNPDAAIPETGVGGFAPTAHIVYVSVDSSFKMLKEKIGEEIKSTLAHELHHCARWASVTYGTTLLEALVSEGLADHFDIEINGGDPKPWDTALQEPELQQVRDGAKTEFNNPSYDHSVWFFGSDKTHIPRWAGYSLGFHLVAEHMKKGNKTAAELVHVPAEVFVR